MEAKMFVRVGKYLINAKVIYRVDLSMVEDLTIVIYDDMSNSYQVQGIEAIDLLMALKPSVLENRRLRWKKNMWMVHNLLGHPLMQIAAFFRQYKLAMWIHDITVPRPLGKKG